MQTGKNFTAEKTAIKNNKLIHEKNREKVQKRLKNLKCKNQGTAQHLNCIKASWKKLKA